MRFLIPTILVASIVVVLVAGATAEQTTTPFWKLRGCPHEHASQAARNDIRELLLNHRAGPPWARARHLALCVSTRRKARAGLHVMRQARLWRLKYENIWPIRRSTIDAGLLARLASIRFCESRGDYSIDTHHDGAYQYLPSTWSRAQAFYQAITGKHVIGWTSQANWASPAHQDVVTAVFYPAHAGEWACG